MVRSAATGLSKSKQSHLNNRKHAGGAFVSSGFSVLFFFFPTKLFRITFPIIQEHAFIIHPIDSAPKEKTQAPSIHTHTLYVAMYELLQTSLGLDTHKILSHFFFLCVIVPWKPATAPPLSTREERQSTEKTPACRQLKICGTHHYDPHRGQSQLRATYGFLWERNYAEAKYFLRTGSSWSPPHPQEQTSDLWWDLNRFEYNNSK